MVIPIAELVPAAYTSDHGIAAHAAIAAALFDATGVQARRIPLTPAYVKTLLQTRTPDRAAGRPRPRSA